MKHTFRSKPDDKLDLEWWKHYAGAGGNDKDRMVQVCNWLLTLSVSIAGAVFIADIKTKLVDPRTVYLILPVFGVIVSLASGLIALIYGGYANWNWATADQIAAKNRWTLLLPSNCPWTDEQKSQGSTTLARWARCLARPAKTYEKLAPIFRIYFYLSLISAVAHILTPVLIFLPRWPCCLPH